MQELLEKIKASAAARLSLLAGRQATQELARYRTFLKVESQRLKIQHRAGRGGMEVCQARATLIDLLLRHLWETARNCIAESDRKQAPTAALVAVGGYGRAELNPHSDLDFMVLHSRPLVAGPPPLLSKMVEGVLYPLWDIGLKIGHSVRTVEECATAANADMQSKTALIEARLITGDPALFERFQKVLLKKCIVGHEADYVRMRVEDQAARRAKFGNSASMQEPNVKNGCGGLRDYQNLLWMAFFKYRTRSLRELQAQGFLQEPERKQLETAYDFLLRVRTEIHYHVNRAMDVLGKNLQPAVAYNLGYRDRSASKRIEAFMRDVYSHLRNIFLLTRTLEQRLALMRPSPRLLSFSALLPKARKAVAEPVDGFRCEDGQIHAVDHRIFREHPRRLMRVFLYAQQRGLRLHPDLAQLIRRQLSLVDRAFLSDEHVRQTFLTILNQRGAVAPVLRAMHEVDFLGKYVPEFGKLTCLVQHEFYHQYTADEHTLMCLEQLDRVWEAEEPSHAPYAALLQKLEQPSLLYLALLLHDVGKADGHGRHTEVSTILAMRAAKRLGLDGTATHTLRLLVEQHLLLPSVSQRRDLDDPAVIRQVAKLVQTPEHLALLTLHTFVDSQATSDKLWNGFKDALLWSLHHRVMALLTGGPEYARAEETQRKLLREQVQRLLPAQVSAEELDAHFTHLPPRYFQIHSPREVMGDLLLAHRFMWLQLAEEDNALAPVVDWRADPDRACTAVKVCTWDRAGLFSKIAGSFSAAGLSILSAQVFSRADGIVVDTFAILDARTGNPAGVEARELFEPLLRKALMGEAVDFHALIGRQRNTRLHYPAYTGERIGTQIRFDNESSDTRTLIEVETEDRLGLLYTISHALAELCLDIAGAKISTERGAAIDSFYVRELDGQKVVSRERQLSIERKLRSILRSPESP